MNVQWRRIIGLALGLAVAAAPSFAQEATAPGSAVSDVSKPDVVESRLANIEERLERLESANTPATPPSPDAALTSADAAIAPEASSLSATSRNTEADPAIDGQARLISGAVTSSGSDGFVVESAEGDFKLQIGLLLQADGQFALSGSNHQVVDSFSLGRLRPYLRGRFSRRFEFYFVPDFAGGNVVVQDAYVDTIFGPAFRLRVGKGKTSFGLERLHSASNLLFFNRALPTALVPNRDIGIQALGDISGGVVSYMVGVMNGVADGARADLDTNDGKDVSGRLIVRPFSKTRTPLKGFGVAISGSRGRQSGTAALPSFRTQSLQQLFFSYNGVTAEGLRTRYSPQFFYYYKAFGAFGEYVRTEMPIRKAAVTTDVAHEAWQVAASYVLTGEPATDAPAGVRPRANFDFGNGHLGAFQVAARYHTLKINDRAFEFNLATPGSSRKAEAWTAGLNWILTGNLKYTLNFERTVFDGNADGPRKAEKAFVFRTQLYF